MISAADYKQIATVMGGGYDDMNYAIAELTSLRNTLQSLTGVDETSRTALRDAVEQCQTYLATRRYPLPAGRTAMKALQSHVTKFAGSVNAFLSTNAIQVSESFAKLSALEGYTIDSSNIAS